MEEVAVWLFLVILISQFVGLSHCEGCGCRSCADGVFAFGLPWDGAAIACSCDEVSVCVVATLSDFFLRLKDLTRYQSDLFITHLNKLFLENLLIVPLECEIFGLPKVLLKVYGLTHELLILIIAAILNGVVSSRVCGVA